MKKIIVKRKSKFYNSGAIDYILTDKQWRKYEALKTGHWQDEDLLAELSNEIKNNSTCIIEISDDVKEIMFISIGNNFERIPIPTKNKDIYYLIHTKGGLIKGKDIIEEIVRVIFY